MVAMLVLSAVLSAQDAPVHHVRASDAKVAALLNAGMSHSTTFREIVDTLDRSDVVVYVESKTDRQALGGYLKHSVVAAGEYRYLQIAIEARGSERRLVSLLAHELQHAVEVSQHKDVRDARAMEQLFNSLAIKFGCDGSTCTETQAAKDVEATVNAELKAAH